MFIVACAAACPVAALLGGSFTAGAAFLGLTLALIFWR
jgi:hypothetical protein